MLRRMANETPAAAPTVLVIEDDAALADLVARHLADSGFAVATAPDAARGWDHLASTAVDLVVLDIMMPGEDGLSLCRRIRREHDVGIVMVTARGEESDRIVGLELGADDYLPKPFSLWELEARLKAVLRRYARNIAAVQERRAGPFRIDLEQRVVTVADRRIDLTRSEFDLFARLTAEPGRVFSREMLLASVQGGETDAFDRAVDTHISNLRRKLEADPKAPRHIKTVWGVGYRFEVD